jgi:predicted metal-dependent phosphoesterase TrpH
MQCFKADLHIHTVLSPCGTLEMSPNNIVNRALEQKLDIIGITDHNSTRHCKLVRKIGNEHGLLVLTGAEITTREEVHCLVFFENDESLDLFQNYIDKWLPFVENNPSKMGYQVIVDEEENILDEVKPLLITGLNQSIEEVCAKVRELNGIFIPAHVDRLYSGILSQLGFIPKGLDVDAIEIWNVNSRDKFTSKYPEYKHYTLIKNSDAHNLSQIGSKYSEYKMEKPSIEELLKAFHNIEGREVKIV